MSRIIKVFGVFFKKFNDPFTLLPDDVDVVAADIDWVTDVDDVLVCCWFCFWIWRNFARRFLNQTLKKPMNYCNEWNKKKKPRKFMWHNEIGLIYEGDWIVLLNPNDTTILLKLRNSYYDCTHRCILSRKETTKMLNRRRKKNEQQ